jgi:protein-S-isoprenylcysteine O-methyltransferase Ste14
MASALTPAGRRDLPPAYLLGSLVVMVLLWFLAPGLQLLGFPWNLAGVLPVSIGIALNVAGDRQFQRAQTTMNPFGAPRELVTTGVFRYSRHPMYLGLVLIVAGLATTVGYATPFAAPALLWIALWYRFIPREERMLSERFGRQYERYVRQGPRRWI